MRHIFKNIRTMYVYFSKMPRVLLVSQDQICEWARLPCSHRPFKLELTAFILTLSQDEGKGTRHLMLVWPQVQCHPLHVGTGKWPPLPKGLWLQLFASGSTVSSSLAPHRDQGGGGSVHPSATVVPSHSGRNLTGVCPCRSRQRTADRFHVHVMAFYLLIFPGHCVEGFLGRFSDYRNQPPPSDDRVSCRCWQGPREHVCHVFVILVWAHRLPVCPESPLWLFHPSRNIDRAAPLFLHGHPSGPHGLERFAFTDPLSLTICSALKQRASGCWGTHAAPWDTGVQVQAGLGVRKPSQCLVRVSRASKPAFLRPPSQVHKTQSSVCLL